MRLETEDGRRVADVEPVIPHGGTLPDEVVFWGTRVFVKMRSSVAVGVARPDVWRETLPLVVGEPPSAR